MPIIGNPVYQSAFVVDQFSGNGTTTAFTMSVAPAGTTNVLVAVSGVLQDPATYGVVGTTLNFSAAPPSGTGNISVRYLGIPATGVTTTAYRTVTEFIATAGQTTFTPPSYTVGFIDVYRNGVLLGSADFTATNGTTIVLANPATAGDLIETISFLVSSVLNAIPNTTGSVGTASIADNAITTVKIAAANVTPEKLSQPLTLGTAVASTSGTNIDFTGIPSWVRRITVMFSGVSTNGTQNFGIRVGTSGGFVTSGYSGSVFNSTGAASSLYSGTNFIQVSVSNSATNIWNGSAVLTLLSSNVWTATSLLGVSNTNGAANGAGSINAGGVLTQLRIMTASTDTFDAGTINILYE